MDEELEVWNKYVMELHEACDAIDQEIKSKYQIALSDEKAGKVEQELLNQSIADAEKWVKEREEQVQEMKNLVKEELKNSPTGNQLMVMDLVQTLGNAAASASNILAGAAASRTRCGAAFNINTKDASFSSDGDQGEDEEEADEVANDPLQHQTDALVGEGFYEQNGDEYLGLDRPLIAFQATSQRRKSIEGIGGFS